MLVLLFLSRPESPAIVILPAPTPAWLSSAQLGRAELLLTLRPSIP